MATQAPPPRTPLPPSAPAEAKSPVHCFDDNRADRIAKSLHALQGRRHCLHTQAAGQLGQPA